MKSRIPLLTVVVLMFGSAAAFAWGPMGHEAIADIADANLAPETRDAIASIIGPNLGLADIANCADALRYGDSDCGGLFNPPLAADKQTAPWHFINIPIQAKVSEAPTTAEVDQYPDCNEAAQGPTAQMMGDTYRDCVQAQILFAVKQLTAPEPTAGASAAAQSSASWMKQRQMALMFLVHFVGDVHQPLHVSDDNDLGGNEEQVNFEGANKSLHELWDDVIQQTPWTDQNLAQSKALAEELISDLSALPPDQQAAWIAGNTETMVNDAVGESVNISEDTIYPDYFRRLHEQFPSIPANQVPSSSMDASHHPTGPIVSLGQDYQDQMQPIAHQRLQQAGLRLAAILNQTLSQATWNGQAPVVSPAKP